MRRNLAALCGVILFASGLHALYIRPDLARVPVERVVKNLQDQLKKEPKNATLHFNLARLHGMAYAKKTDDIEVNQGKGQSGAWFGFEPAFVPFAKAVVKTTEEAKLKAAKEHLEKAIAAYKDTLKLQPDNLAAKLGLAWTIEQSGKKKDAIAAYRKAIEAGWAKEKDRKFGPLGGHYITKEAADYLIPLLDKESDKEEIATLRERSAQLMKLPRPITPIAIPLKDDLKLADIIDEDARVTFDADGTGPRQWNWIRDNAGWLVMDPHQDGKIASGLQMFGSVSFWLFWDNGYQALALLDDNGDGELAGPELRHLAIWCDKNGNGVSDPGEVRPLAAYGIVALSCRSERAEDARNCAAYALAGVRFQDGRTRASYDVILKTR